MIFQLARISTVFLARARKKEGNRKNSCRKSERHRSDSRSAAASLIDLCNFVWRVFIARRYYQHKSQSTAPIRGLLIDSAFGIAAHTFNDLSESIFIALRAYDWRRRRVNKTARAASVISVNQRHNVAKRPRDFSAHESLPSRVLCSPLSHAMAIKLLTSRKDVLLFRLMKSL